VQLFYYYQLDTQISCSFTQITLNSSTCFERNPLIIRRSKTQIVRMQPLVLSLSASDCLVQPLRQDWLVEPTSLALAVAQDGHLQRVTIPEVAYVQFVLMMSGLRSKHVEEFNVICVNEQEICVSSW
jgi:hypothetical protein